MTGTFSSRKDTGAGMAEIRNIVVTNGTVSVSGFARGDTVVYVTATKTDPSQPTTWSFDAVDVDGNVKHCS